MLRRPFCGMAACFLLGIWVAAHGGHIGFPLTVIAGGSVIFWLWRRRIKAALGEMSRSGTIALRMGLFALMFLAGRAQYRTECAFRAEYLPYLEEGMQLSVQGRLAEKQVKNNQYIYELESCVIGLYQKEQSKKVPVSCNRILVYSDSDVSSIGQILVLDGTVELWESAVNEGNFDAKSFYEAQKTDFKIKDIQIRDVHGAKNGWREALWRLRLRLKEIYQSTMDSEACGIVTTMVLGDKDLLDSRVKQLYQVGGISHILAISGLHISVIGMTLYRFLRKRGLGYASAGILAGGIVCAYGTMVGMGTSVRRSVVMFLLLLAAQAIGRTYDTPSALGVAALLLLWDNPFLLWDAGFLFSFTAIIGVVWVGRSVRFGEDWSGKCLEKIFGAAAVYLATLPLAAWYYYEIPVYAVLLNLLVLPMMGVLLCLALMGGILGMWFQHLAEIILFPCGKLLELCNLLCQICAELPGAMLITGRPKMWRMLVYYTLLVGLTLLGHRRARVLSMGKIDTGEREDVRACAGWRAGTVARALLAAVALLGVLCAPARAEFELDVLDVGQGDACFLRTGQGYTIFVDGGSSNVGKVGEYRILPFLKYKGARRIDCWVVSHTDADHVSGLTELLEAGFDIRRLVFSEVAVRDEALAELLGCAERAGAEVYYLNAGDRMHFGGAEISVLFPEARDQPENKNASSLVFCYEEGDFSGIFTGDIGAAQEMELLERWEVGRLSADFYKAAHHGSKYSNSEAFLQAVEPAVSVISCARKNRYGHPSAEAVAHMEGAGSDVFYTMEAGQITLTRKDGAILVRRYLTQ